mmetsp:Transcript_1437/g.4315  ORF Transcript_1437/g.4315 Transcript_1437/m.4315 type:complete len:345 (-) Transcript_1437:44-1078(-)
MAWTRASSRRWRPARRAGPASAPICADFGRGESSRSPIDARRGIRTRQCRIGSKRSSGRRAPRKNGPRERDPPAQAGARRFFARADKASFCHGPYGNPLGGYTSVGVEAVARSRDAHGTDGGGADAEAPPDLVESFVYKPEEPTKPKPPELAAAAAYHAALLGVLGLLNAVSEAALGLGAGYFGPFYAPPKVSLRLAHYPPLSAAAAASRALRYGAHTDYTGFTILRQDPADEGREDAGGLEVRVGERWVAVRPRADAFVVNAGDLLEVWTNGRWRSAVHRVAKPPPGSAAAAAPRLSVPFFTGPGDDARIEALPTCVDAAHPRRYEAVTAGEHLRRKLGISNV